MGLSDRRQPPEGDLLPGGTAKKVDASSEREDAGGAYLRARRPGLRCLRVIQRSNSCASSVRFSSRTR